jgi:hypothetical protein
MTPEELVELYRTVGYDFICFTDHGVLTETRGLSKPGFLVIPGEEVSVGISENGRFTHIIGVNLAETLSIKDFDRTVDPQEAIDTINRYGGFAVVAHPYWSDLILEDLRELQGHLGLEVYNATCELTIGRGYSSVHWDGLLSRGIRLKGFAVDDTHGFQRPFLPLDLGRAWINVKAEKLTAESVVEAIKKGLFYSSNGPVIRGVDLSGGEVWVSSSPAKSIAFIADMIHGVMNTVEEGTIDEAYYTIKGEENYVRIEVTDWEGRKAWSNPIYIER